MGRQFGVIAVVVGLGGLGAGISLEGFSESDTDAGIEAGHDAASPEAQPQADSGAADEDGAPPPAFRCSAISPVPAFCTDFDQGTLTSIFGTPDTVGGATLTLDD